MARCSRIGAVFGLGLGLCLAAVACGSDDKDDDKEATASASGTVAFATVNAIIKKTCADGGCHGQSQPGSVVFENNEANVKNISAAGQALLNNGKSDSMPKAGSGKVLSASDKELILKFIRQ